MAVIQAAIAGVMRSLGKIFNTAFGWATILLFGKVPEDRQIYLSVITFGSVAWIAVLLGIAFPAFGAWLLAFVNPPRWVDRNWIRLAMLIGAIMIPLIIGFLSLKLSAPEDAPENGIEKLKAVMRGYPYTLGLAITLVMLTVFAPILHLRNVLNRWTSQHVPVIVEAPDYLGVVGEMEQALRLAGYPTVRRRASWMLRMPTKVLTALAGGAVQKLVADHLTILAAKDFEVVLHPSDLIISGKDLDAARIRAILSEALAFTKAYLTWTKEANELEDRLVAIWNEMQQRTVEFVPLDGVRRLEAVETNLRNAKFSYDEWDVLSRKKLLVERGLLQVQAGVTDRPVDPTEVPPEDIGASQMLEVMQNRTGLLSRLATAATFGALAWLGVKNRRAAR